MPTDPSHSTAHIPLFSLIVLVLLCVASCRRVPGWWRGTRKELSFGTGWFAMQLGFVFLTLGSIAVYLVAKNIFAGPVLDVLVLLFAGLFLLSLCVAPIVMLFNKPSFLVPPRLRNERTKFNRFWNNG